MTKLSLLLASLLLVSFNSLAEATQLAGKASAAQHQEISHNQQREAEFAEQRRVLTNKKNQLTAELAQLQNKVDLLSAQFSTNEQRLAELEQQLNLETGSLGELFGVVRQSSKELQTELKHSITAADQQSYNSDIEAIVAADKLPSLEQLRHLWQAYEEQIAASGDVARITLPYVTPAGETNTIDAIRLGNFALIGDAGPLDWLSEQKVVMDYPRLPGNSPAYRETLPILNGDVVTITIDPTKGELIKQMAQTPTLLERIQQGGIVGYIILVLLSVGLIISLVRLVVLTSVKRKISLQLKSDAILHNNPLGRVLAVNQGEAKLHSEALELRLLEVVMDEQGRLESGLSMIKLLAALAPMLGLLGTVSGMIETFQVITQYGNGDPSIMAGGISTALITTVLGLIAAMPLLLTHNILSGQAETIRLVLEKQGIGLVAERAEQHCFMSPDKQVAI